MSTPDPGGRAAGGPRVACGARKFRQHGRPAPLRDKGVRRIREGRGPRPAPAVPAGPRHEAEEGEAWRDGHARQGRACRHPQGPWDVDPRGTPRHGAARRAVRRRRARVRALRDHPSGPEVRRPRRRGAARQGPQGRDRAADACDCRLAKGIRIGGLSRPRSQGPRQTALPEPKRRPSGQGRCRRHPSQACGRGEEVRCRHPRGCVAPLVPASEGDRPAGVGARASST